MQVSSLRTELKLAYIMLLLSAVTAVFTVALVMRCYMPCPFWDHWWVIGDIAEGSRPSSLRWLWSQHNEHRIAILRVLIYLDIFAFGAKNVSLQVESLVIQLLQWAAICYFIERYTLLPLGLKRSIEGIYAFFLFHPKQENFLEPFQVSFILPFALGTVAFLLVTFFRELRRPVFSMAVAAVVPLLAALNLAGGLLIGPVLTALAVVRGLPKRFVILISVAWIAATAAYLIDLHRLGPAVMHANQFVSYILLYFSERWFRIGRYEDVPVVLASLLGLILVGGRALGRREQVSAFEWFLTAESVLAILSACVTATGRLQFGVGQARSTRYQTVALLYWSSFFSLVLVRVWRWRPSSLKLAQMVMLAIILLSIYDFPRLWRMRVAEPDSLRLACTAVMSEHYTKAQAAQLLSAPELLGPRIRFLRQRWAT